MTLLLPLGLLGLLSLAALILIYVLRPNYQQKLVSTTFVWKLSMKYKKNRLPISRLRNILILLCQLILLASLALMMAQPAVPTVFGATKNEKVAIIDASASMMVASSSGTRFERAVKEVQSLANRTLALDDGVVSVIVADEEAHFVATRVTGENSDTLTATLNTLLADGSNACTYGSADLNGAAELAESVLEMNSEAEVLLYTGKNYRDGDTGSFTVVDIADDDDWNAAVLNVTAELDDASTYTFNAEVGSFGLGQAMTVTCIISGINGTNGTRTFTKTAYCSEALPVQTVTYGTSDFGEQVYSFTSAYVSLDQSDTLQRDNTFNVYGGTKPALRIQYASSLDNNFYPGIIRTARDNLLKNKWNVEFKQIASSQASLVGYDMYIFEHTMPDEMPDDGLVILADPDKVPAGAGFELGAKDTVDSDSTLALGKQTSLTQFMDASRIKISTYRPIGASDGYDDLFYFNGAPVIIAKNQPDCKVVVISLDLNYSTLSVTPEFVAFFYNIFNEYLPATLSQSSYEVGDTVTMNARGENLSVSLPGGGEQNFDETPATLVADTPGDYTVTQTVISGDPVVDQFFVHIPRSESNLAEYAEKLPDLYAATTEEEGNESLIIWFAIAALVLLTAEWLLHTRENI